MRVLTLNEISLEEHARRLAGMVEKDSGFRPNAVVGVRRGGSVVCDAFCRHFPSSRYGLRCDVCKQRASTKRKSGKVSAILKRLPYGMLNIMRMAESALLSLTHRQSSLKPASVEIPAELMQILKIQKNPEILIIDDAIDSGLTVCAVIDSLKKVNPDATVKVAVITVTTNSPLVNADYFIYNNRTLIRFPWSEDFKR